MGDIFKEQIVRKAATTKDTIIRTGVISIVVIIALFVFLVMTGLAPIVTLGLGFGAYHLLSYLNVEYEYSFTNGELDIDCIYSKSRRKTLFSGRVSEFEIMAHVQNRDHERELNTANETRDYSSGKVKQNTYAFLTNYKGKRVKIIIEPNEKMVQALSTALTPRKFIK